MLNAAYPISQSRAVVVKVMSVGAYWLTATRESDGSDLPPFPTSVSAVKEWPPCQRVTTLSKGDRVLNVRWWRVHRSSDGWGGDFESTPCCRLCCPVSCAHVLPLQLNNISWLRCHNLCPSISHRGRVTKQCLSAAAVSGSFSDQSEFN